MKCPPSQSGTGVVPIRFLNIVGYTSAEQWKLLWWVSPLVAPCDNIAYNIYCQTRRQLGTLLHSLFYDLLAVI